jgi:DNA mismatch repair protein MutL
MLRAVMRIHILPPDVQQKIAAGEVIERPASVVKELVENALDAGAMEIRVEVQEGGRRLIRVIDDGSGIPASEIRLACERFATSKIAREEDLRAVRTFGFRGEALPSIATVSRLRLLSRERDALLGTEVRLDAGQLLVSQEMGAAVGTTVEVWDLFYNTPARRQFMRSLRTEYGHILGVFTRFALAFPERRFSLFFDGRELYAFEPSSISERITACFGREASAGLEAFEGSGITGRAWGFVLPTEAVWRRRYYFFVNHRAVRNRALYRAVRDALPGEGGIVLLFLDIAPAFVDVNMHPAKTEVRFRDDPSVYDLVRGALRRRSQPAWLQSERVAEPEATYDQTPTNHFALLGQIERTFLLMIAEGHLYILDQHAAEERVLYELLQGGAVQRRDLIAPQVVTLSPDEQGFVDAKQEEISHCGFTAESFGPQVIALRTVPDFISPKEASMLFSRWLVRVRQHGENFHQALSCVAAVKAGQELEREEQARLLERWRQTVNPHACAHNRPVYFRLALDEVRRKIGRTGLSCEFDTPSSN